MAWLSRPKNSCDTAGTATAAVSAETTEPSLKERTIESLLQEASGFHIERQRQEQLVDEVLGRLPELDASRLPALKIVCSSASFDSLYNRQVVEICRTTGALTNPLYLQSLHRLAFTMVAQHDYEAALPLLLELLETHSKLKELHSLSYELGRMLLLPVEILNSGKVIDTIADVLSETTGSGTYQHQVVFERCAKLLTKAQQWQSALETIERAIQPRSDDNSRFQNPQYNLWCAIKLQCLTRLRRFDEIPQLVDVVLAEVQRSFDRVEASRPHGGGGG